MSRSLLVVAVALAIADASCARDARRSAAAVRPAGAAAESFARSDGSRWRIRRDIADDGRGGLVYPGVTRAQLVAADPGAACCAEPVATPPGEAPRCRAQGCVYRQATPCHGTDPGPERMAEEAREAAACRVACACLCPPARPPCP